MVDPIVEAVREKLAERSRVGVEKYGATMARTDIDRLGWLVHAQQEALDFSVYLERLIHEEREMGPGRDGS